MNSRLQNAVQAFDNHQIDALLVINDPNITYLIEFPASESWLLVTPHKSFYITDFRYVLEAQKGLQKGVTVHPYQGSMIDAFLKLAESLKVKRLGIEEQHLTLAQYKLIKSKCPKSIQLVTTQRIVESLRETKDQKEITQIRQALKLHRETYFWLKKYLKPGLSEEKVLLELEYFVKSRGAGFSFDSIIASGPNSCYPHAKVTPRKISKQDLVLVDMGIDTHGYKSDLTRLFFFGKMAPLVKEVHDCVYEAQQRAIAKVKAGAVISEVDQAARNYLATKKLAEFFGHALGHGVGLEIHESPRISQQSSSLLKENMVITIEPAVYIPNKFGIRLEEMVLVKQNGCEVLSDNIN